MLRFTQHHTPRVESLQGENEELRNTCTVQEEEMRALVRGAVVCGVEESWVRLVMLDVGRLERVR